MKVLHISSSSKIDGGAEFCLIELINEELMRGIQPFVIVPRAGELENYLRQNNILCFVVNSHPWRHNPKQNKVHSIVAYTIKQALNYFAEKKVASIIKQNNIDLIHINTTATCLGHLAAKRTSKPLVWHIREFNDPKLKITFYSDKSARKIIGKSSAVIAVSNCVKNAFNSYISPEKLYVIYDKISFSPKKRVAQILESNYIRICLIANIAPQKGQIDALKALSILPDNLKKTTRLRIVGKIVNKNYFHTLREFTKENNLESIVSFEGFTTDVCGVLNDSDIALNCSWSESFGRTTVEAMLSGCLVIGSNNTCTHELLSNNRGFLYDDPEELTSLIIGTNSDKNKARFIALNGQKFAQNSFNDGPARIINLFKTVKNKPNKKITFL